MKIIRHLLIICYVLSFQFPAFAAPGDLETGFDPNVTGLQVDAAALQPDGKIIIAGLFSNVGGVARGHIARVNANGTLDAVFNPNADNEVATIALQADGKIVVLGFFSTIGGVARDGIARLNADGSVDLGFSPVLASISAGSPQPIAIQPDGRMFIARGGAITRLNTDGTLDSSFNVGVNGTVFAMVLQTDWKLVVSGTFTSVGGQPRSHMARLLANGTLDPAFDPNLNPAVGPYHLAIQADGKILLAGNLINVNGVARKALARVQPDGTLEVGFNPDANDEVHTPSVQADGKIIIGGQFSNVGGQQRIYLARLAGTGALDAAWAATTFPFSFVYSTVLQADGKVLIGGGFSNIFAGGPTVPRNRIARLDNDTATQSLTVPGANRVQWLRGGASPETQHVSFERSANGGSTWALLGAGTRIGGGWELTGLSLSGSGHIRARARVGIRSSGLVEAVTAYSFTSPFNDWKLTQLGDANAPDLGDTDFDGLVHLAEYALNLSPTAFSLPPAVTRFVYAEGERLRMFFTRDPARNDVTLEVQSADSPAGLWTTVAASTLGGVTTGPGYVGGDGATPGLKTVEVRDAADISPATASRYLRVKVTH